MPGEIGRGDIAYRQFIAAFEHVGIGHFLRADPHIELCAEFGDQRTQLIEQIGAEMVGLGDGDSVITGRLQNCPGAPGCRGRAVRTPRQQ